MILSDNREMRQKNWENLRKKGTDEDEAPKSVENVPALQLMQAFPAYDDHEPGLQRRQDADDVAPMTLEYVLPKHKI